MKRLIVCCDGTWNSLEKSPTNVVKLAQACRTVASNGIRQLIYYDEGLGTSRYKIDTFFGGAFGWGIDKNIQEAYRFLCLNYEDGDEIYLYGFSRGAYTIRSLAGMMYCSGLLKREHLDHVDDAYQLYRNPKTRPNSDSQSDTSNPDESTTDASLLSAPEFRQNYSRDFQITLLGCWDTVGALGIPQVIGWIPINEIVNRKYKFHDVKVNRKVQHALHAIAIDERRLAFDVSRMQPSDGADTRIQEVWFPGNHGAVGGGTPETQGLSDATLEWMITESKGVGLEFNDDWLKQILKPQCDVEFSNGLGIYALAGPNDRTMETRAEYIEAAIEARWQEEQQKKAEGTEPTQSQEDIVALIRKGYENYTVSLHSSVRDRYQKLEKYRTRIKRRKNIADAYRQELQSQI